MDKKRFPIARELYAELDKKRVARAYLFLGEDEGEKDKAVRRIAALVLSGPGAEHSLGRFHCEMGELMQAADFTLNRSMFSDARICVLLNIDAIPAGAANTALLAEVFGSLSDSTVLVMTTRANSPPGRIGASAIPGMKVYHFWPPFENDLVAYIVRALEPEGISIDARPARALVDLLGRDVRAVDGALEKLRNAGVARVTEETVRSLIGGEKDYSLFEFVDALYRGDRSSPGLLKNLIENNCPELLILNQMARQADSIERYHLAVRAGDGEDEALQKASVPPRAGKAFLELARRNPIIKIKRIYPLLHKADFALKSYRVSKSVVAGPLFDLSREMLALEAAPAAV
ncbi:MAG TPA: DNA polymerase III subunit delta [Spirochaetota bacterium]|nr:DNA polymerase III subunit delta [Spirochaetota bacterium]